MIAAIAPMPAGTASCIACARKRTSGNASRNASAPAATSAVYSPRLCPARTIGIGPPAACHARHVATPAVSITGCVLVVRFSASAGPCSTSAHRSSPSASEASANVSRTTGCAAKPPIMPTALRALPGKHECELHVIAKGRPDLTDPPPWGQRAKRAWGDVSSSSAGPPKDRSAPSGGSERSERGGRSSYHLRKTEPHVKPPPTPSSMTCSPALMRPSRTAMSSAIGIDAADVLPC